MITDKQQWQGKQMVLWSPDSLPQGVYYCVLKTGNEIRTLKMIKQN